MDGNGWMEKSNGHMIFNHFKDRNRINLPHHTRRKSQQFIKSILNHTITVSILTRVVGRSFARNTSHCGNCLGGFCSTAEQRWWSQAAHVPTRCCQAGNSADYKERQSPVDTWHYLVFALWIYIRINICCRRTYILPSHNTANKSAKFSTSIEPLTGCRVNANRTKQKLKSGNSVRQRKIPFKLIEFERRFESVLLK